MSKQANPTLVGAFVLGALALMAAAVVLLVDGGFWRERPAYIMYFEGSTTGLQVGSLVIFRGVPIGSVESIGLTVDEQNLTFLVPVVVRTDEYALKNMDGRSVALTDLTENKDLIKRGLRARLKTLSFLTGQLYIDLDFYPEKTPTYHGKENGMREIPTLPTEVEELTNKLDKLNVEKLVDDISAISASVRSLVSSPEASSALSNLNATLEHLASLTKQLDSRTSGVTDQARGVLDEATATLRATRNAVEEGNRTLAAGRQALGTIDAATANIAALTRADSGPVQALNHAAEELATTARALRAVAGEDSATATRLNDMLEQTAAAARALRLLAEAIEIQPESLISGRRDGVTAE
ncbi:MAG: MlaD family protein [Gammaproteobacteria bacterium]